MRPDIRYARSGGVAIAYQVVGDGDVDLVYVPDYVSNLVYGWEVPYWRAFYERLAQSFRLILFDKRGTGLSDLGGALPGARDADGRRPRRPGRRGVVERGRCSASHDGCSMAALYAATYPERTRALVLFHPLAHDRLADRRRLGRPRRPPRALGDARVLRRALRPDAAVPRRRRAGREWFANWLRVGASPAVAYALNRAWSRPTCARCCRRSASPTLVLYRDARGERGSA